jgi:hypothetical protein
MRSMTFRLFNEVREAVYYSFKLKRRKSNLAKVRAGVAGYVLGDGTEIPDFYDNWRDTSWQDEKHIYAVRKFKGVTYVYVGDEYHEHDRLRFAGVGNDFYEVTRNCSMDASLSFDQTFNPVLMFRDPNVSIAASVLLTSAPGHRPVRALANVISQIGNDYSFQDMHDLFYHTDIFAEKHGLSDMPEEYVRVLTAGVNSLEDKR